MMFSSISQLLFLLAVAFSLPITPISAQESTSNLSNNAELVSSPSMEEGVQAHLISDLTAFAPGSAPWIGVTFQVPQPWHVYSKNAGEGGMPLQINWKLPKGYSLGRQLWPVPKTIEHEGLTSFVYDAPFTVLQQLVPESSLSQPDPLAVGVEAQWLACSDESCVPGDFSGDFTWSLAQQQIPSAQNALIQTLLTSHIEAAQLAALETNHVEGGQRPHLPGDDLVALAPLSEPSQVALRDNSSEFLFEGGFLGALFFAFLGGIILNFMPCVLPVISLKILSFVKLGGKSPRAILFHGLSFTGGVLLSFWALAAAMLILQAYGASVGWGFQLQEPRFVAALSLLLFAFALSMFGLYEVGGLFAGRIGSKGQALSKAVTNKGVSTYFSSLASGILATAVATPCTGPFLGPAVGFAITLPAWKAMSVFTSLGLGMSSPYLLLSRFPHFLWVLPKPGPWMDNLKKFVGFALLATALWLLLGLDAQIQVLLQALLLVALSCWLLGRFATPLRSNLCRFSAIGTAVVLAIGALLMVHNDVEARHKAASQFSYHNHPIEQWIPFNEEYIARLKEEGKPIFIDFTARWCLICQYNHLVLSQDSVNNEMAKRGIVKMKADWTRQDDVITNWLRKYGRNGVPLYIYIDSQGKAVVLPQVLTADVVLSHFNP